MRCGVSLLAMVAVLAGCGDPDSLADVSGDILSVQSVDGEVMVLAKAPSLLTAAKIAFDAAKWQAGHLHGVDGLALTLYVPTVDRFGKKGMDVALGMRFEAADLAKVQWKNLFFTDILDLATINEVTPFGRDWMTEFCGDSSNAKVHALFCFKALAALAR